MNKAITMREVVAGVSADPREMSPRQVLAFGDDLHALAPYQAPAPRAAAACRVCGVIAELDSAGLCSVPCVVVVECLRHIAGGRRVRAYMLARQLRLIELDHPTLLKITRRKDDRATPGIFFFAAATRAGLELVQ